MRYKTSPQPYQGSALPLSYGSIAENPLTKSMYDPQAEFANSAGFGTAWHDPASRVGDIPGSLSTVRSASPVGVW